jgi:hypothetical protein
MKEFVLHILELLPQGERDVEANLASEGEVGVRIRVGRTESDIETKAIYNTPASTVNDTHLAVNIKVTC